MSGEILSTHLGHELRVLLDAAGVVRVVEEDEEGETLLSQLLGVLKRNIPHQWSALVLNPPLHVVQAVQKAVIKKEIFTIAQTRIELTN